MVIKIIKRLIKLLYNNLKRLKFIRQIRYSEFGWKIYFKIFQNIKNITETEYLLYKMLGTKQNHTLAFDIGANQGINTSHLLRLGYTVVSVEPESRNFESLKFRFEKNKNVKLVNSAISNISGEKHLSVEIGNSLHTLSEKWKNNAQTHLDRNVNFEKLQLVKTQTIEKLISEYGIPDFLKIDVEGHEVEVFEGLKQSIQLIIFESNLPEFYNETLKIIDMLKSLNENYKFDVFIENSVIPFNKKIFLDLYNSKSKTSVEIICRLPNTI